MTTSNDNGGQCSESVTLSDKELIILFVFTPVVFVWLFLAARIILSASTNPNTLDNIEGLLKKVVKKKNDLLDHWFNLLYTNGGGCRYRPHTPLEVNKVKEF